MELPFTACRSCRILLADQLLAAHLPIRVRSRESDPRRVRLPESKRESGEGPFQRQPRNPSFIQDLSISPRAGGRGESSLWGFLSPDWISACKGCLRRTGI